MPILTSRKRLDLTVPIPVPNITRLDLVGVIKNDRDRTATVLLQANSTPGNGRTKSLQIFVMNGGCVGIARNAAPTGFDDDIVQTSVTLPTGYTDFDAASEAATTRAQRDADVLTWLVSSGLVSGLAGAVA